MVEWLVSESMVMYYIRLFRDSTWPGGELAKPAVPRTDAVRKLDFLHWMYVNIVIFQHF